VEAAAEQLGATFPPGGDLDSLSDLCAELAPLVRLGCCAADRVVLYASDSLTGQVTATALARALEKRCPGLAVRLRIIEGLRVDDGEAFRRQGVVNFVKAISDDIERFGAAHCTLNPLGGYKALVPYSVMVAMVCGIRSCYIFEGTSTLLSLPSLPLDFPPSLLESMAPLCERIEQETSIRTDELEKLCRKSGLNRDHLEILFEQDGHEVTFSAVGMLLWRTLKGRRPLLAYISHQALEEFWRLEQREDCQPSRFINSICQSPAQLESKRHGHAGAGLTWLKPGNTTDRYLVSVEEGWRLLIWRAVDHTEYDRLNDQRALGRDLRGSSAVHPFVRLDLFVPS
jgi:hypothetical protein